MSFKTAFIDPQGTEFSDAYFEVSLSSINRTSNDLMNNRISIGTVETSSNSSAHLTYEMYYWPSEQNKLDGDLPYILANREPMGTQFYVDISSSEYDEMSPEEAAEYHCQTYVL